MKTVSYQQAELKLISLLTEKFGADAAKRCAEVIMWSEAGGAHFQALLKLAGDDPLQNIKPMGPLEITEPSPLSALINANQQPSFYATQVGIDTAISKAKQHGISLVGINNTFSSNGALGFYAERLANENLIGLIMARSPGAVAPFGTLAQLFGTNPLAVGFPTNDEPLVFDMATSAITWYGLVLAKMQGKKIPDGVAIDKNGSITLDPADAMDGGILPFDGGYKGSALSMMVEILSGPLVGASHCDTTFDKDWGTFILAINPALLVDVDQFKTACTDVVKTLRSAKTIDGKPVTLPGDRHKAHRAKVIANDLIEIEDAVAELLKL